MDNNPQHYLNKILPILSAVKEDKEQLAKILFFLETEIAPQMKDGNDSIMIPEKFEVLVNSIAQSINAGLICYLNLNTFELEEIPESYLNDIEDGFVEDEDFVIKHTQWERVLTFVLLESSESFRIMENFANQLGDNKVQNILVNILNRSKPFANFNNYIHDSDYRENWFAFRNTAYEKHVRETIYYELNKGE